MTEQKSLSAWKEAVEYTKIPRMDWKSILESSLTMYLMDHQFTNNEELTRIILIKAKNNINELKM